MNLWIPIHVGLSIVGECLLAFSLLLGVVYLIQERRLKNKIVLASTSFIPSLEMLDNTQYRLLKIGFVSLSLGVVLGTLWAFKIWGFQWVMSPKQMWMFAGWLIYGIILQARRATGFRGRRAAWTSLIGFALVLFSGWHGFFRGFFS